MSYPNDEDVVFLRNVTTVGVTSQKKEDANLRCLSSFSFLLCIFPLTWVRTCPLLTSDNALPIVMFATLPRRQPPRHKYIPNCFLAHMLPGQQTFPYTRAPLGNLIFIFVVQGFLYYYYYYYCCCDDVDSDYRTGRRKYILVYWVTLTI